MQVANGSRCLWQLLHRPRGTETPSLPPGIRGEQSFSDLTFPLFGIPGPPTSPGTWCRTASPLLAHGCVPRHRAIRPFAHSRYSSVCAQPCQDQSWAKGKRQGHRPSYNITSQCPEGCWPYLEVKGKKLSRTLGGKPHGEIPFRWWVLGPPISLAWADAEVTVANRKGAE